jgi:Arc/MetJ-type ribon-helix-helix transcriptional regulator
MATITFRTDNETDAAIQRLRRRAGVSASQSDVIRQAILDADRVDRNERLRHEAAEIMADPEQAAETMRANAFMEALLEG